MNQILETTRQQILESVKPPQLTQAIEKVVEAGKKILYSPDTREMVLQELQSDGEMQDVIGSGVAKLTGLVYSEYKKTLPMEVLMPVCMLLMIEVLDFLEQGGKVQVTNEFLAEVTQSTASAMLQLLGVTPEKLEEYTQQAQGGASPQAAQPQQPAQPEERSLSATQGEAIPMTPSNADAETQTWHAALNAFESELCVMRDPMDSEVVWLAVKSYRDGMPPILIHRLPWTLWEHPAANQDPF